MSISHTVFLRASDVPTVKRLNEALRREGFALRLDEDLESLAERNGTWPATHRSQRVEVEIFVQPARDVDLSPAERKRVGTRDVAVSFVTHASERDLAAAIVSAAVLAAMSPRALLYVEEAGDLVEGAAELLALARDADVETPDPPPRPARVAYPVIRETKLEARERRRTAHSLHLEAGTTHFVLYLKTAPLAPPVVGTVTRILDVGPSTHRVLLLDVGGRRVELSPKGRVLDPQLALDYEALCGRLGETESVTQALLAGERSAAAALTRFVADERADVGRRRLGVVTLGLLGDDAADAHPVLARLRAHPALGHDADTALTRVDRALGRET